VSLRVAETKLHAAFVAGIFIIIAVPVSRRRFKFRDPDSGRRLPRKL